METAKKKPVLKDAGKVNVGRIALNAIRKLQGKSGVSLRDLKKFLRDEKKVDVAAQDLMLKLSLKNALDRGTLVKEGGNFKVKEAKRRRSRSRSKRGKSTGRRRKRSGSKKRGRSGRRKGSSKKRRSRSKRRIKAGVEIE